MKKYGYGDSGWFQHDRFGMFIHRGFTRFPPAGKWVRNREYITDEGYQTYFNCFEPELFQPSEWARTAKNAGMKYVVVTAKRHEGFCLWDSKHTDYKAANAPRRAIC